MKKGHFTIINKLMSEIFISEFDPHRVPPKDGLGLANISTELPVGNLLQFDAHQQH